KTRRALHHLLEVLGGDHEGEVERKGDHGDAGDEQHVDEQAIPGERLLPRGGHGVPPDAHLLPLPRARCCHLTSTCLSACLPWDSLVRAIRWGPVTPASRVRAIRWRLVTPTNLVRTIRRPPVTRDSLVRAIRWRPVTPTNLVRAMRRRPVTPASRVRAI